MSSEYEFWVTMHNNLGDRAARLSNLCLTVEFWDLHRHQAQGTTVMAEVGKWVSHVILTVSRAVVTRQATHDTDGSLTQEGPDELTDLPAVPAGTWAPFAIESPIPWQFTNMYGFSIVAEIAGWFSHAAEEAANLGEQPRWLSTYQLYLDYQLATVGKPGPISDKKWIDPIVFGQTIACGRYHFVSVLHGSPKS